SAHVYCVQRPDLLSCSYFVARPAGDIVLIDAGMDVEGQEILEGVKQAGFDPNDVSTILITHWHNDHSTGAAEAKRRTDARVLAHTDAVERLARREMATGLRGWIGGRLPESGYLGSVRGLLELAPPRAVEVDQAIPGDMLLEDFRAVETPGHVRGHLSYLYEPDQVLFTGDALAVANRHLTFMSRFLTEDIELARQSMIRCLDLEAHAYCPGHREPLIEPSAEHLARLRDKLESIRWWPIIGCGDH
ncbi:MAG: MBL fold metallo-hydrolase, partial [Planctomycetota bacterium]